MSTQNTNGPPSGDTVSSPAAGYAVAYRHKSLVIQTMQGAGCGYSGSVNINTPSVDPSNGSSNTFELTGQDCVNNVYRIRPGYEVAGTKPTSASQGQDDPAGCISAIASDPNPGSDTARPGYGFCVKGMDNLIAYVKITSVDVQGDVTLQLDGWTTNAAADTASSPAAGYAVAYRHKSLVIQTMQGAGCGYSGSVNINTPSVDPSNGSSNTFELTGQDCVNNVYRIRPGYEVAGTKPTSASQGQDDPAGCISAIASDPNPGSDTARPGYGFCVKGMDNFIAYVKITSVDVHGDVALQLDGWTTN